MLHVARYLCFTALSTAVQRESRPVIFNSRINNTKSLHDIFICFFRQISFDAIISKISITKIRDIT